MDGSGTVETGGAAEWTLAEARSYGVPVPDSLVRRHLEPLAVEGPLDLAVAYRAAAMIGDEERMDRLRRTLSGWEESGEHDPEALERLRRRVRPLDAWAGGDAEEALAATLRLSETERVPPPWLARLYRETGRLQDAARCYRSGWREPVAWAGLGEVERRLGRHDEAAEAFRVFVDAWEGDSEGADPGVRAMAEDVRARLAEVEGRDPSRR